MGSNRRCYGFSFNDPKSETLGAETFTARAMRGGFRIGDLKAAFLKIVTVIEQRTGHKLGTLGVHHHINVAGADENVAVGRTVDEIHFILQTGATAADNGQTQGAIWTSLTGQQRAQLLRGLLGNFAKLFVADDDLRRGFGGFGHFHTINMVRKGVRRKLLRQEARYCAGLTLSAGAFVNMLAGAFVNMLAGAFVDVFVGAFVGDDDGDAGAA